MSMWEPFTEGARRAMVFAHDEARLHGLGLVEIEDLLMGIIAAQGSVAAQVLAAHDVSVESARQIIRDTPTSRPTPPKYEPPEIVFAPNAKRSIEGAFAEARKLNHNHIGTEHLLLAILRVNETEQSAAVARICGDPARLREEIVQAIPQGASTGGSRKKDSFTFGTSSLRAVRVGQAAQDPFTEDARQSLAQANVAAGSFNLSRVGNEHLLLGIWRAGKGSGYETLLGAGLSGAQIEAAVDAISLKGDVAPKEMEFTTEARQTIQQAFAAAMALKQTFVASGHLLLGVIADKETGGRIFQALALNTEALQKDAIARLQQL